MEIEYSNDLLNLLCGEKLGEGAYRVVFASKLDSTRVIKRDNAGNWSNINEWQLYNEFCNSDIAPWLAPCYSISPNGLWLIQARTKPIELAQLPFKIPAIFADTKIENWGLLDGKPVCHDYGNNNVFRRAYGPGKKLVNAHWL